MTGAQARPRDHLATQLGAPVRVDANRYRPNDQPIVVGDARRIRDEIGWTPEVPIERTLDDLIDYWRGDIAETR